MMAKVRWRRDYTNDIKDLKEKYDDLKEHINDPPDGQIPLNDWGLYTSRNLQTGESVDPRDCDAYPDSPWCGGNPWTKLPVGFEPDWGINECGGWVQLTPVLGFTKLPPVSIGWRRPGKCREEEKPPPQLPIPGVEDRNIQPLKFPREIDPEVKVFIVLSCSYNYTYIFQDIFQPNPPTWEIQSSVDYLEDEYFPTTEMVESYYPYAPSYAPIPILAIAGATIKASSSYADNYSPGETIAARNNSANYTGWITTDQKPPWPSYPNFKRYTAREITGNYLITAVGFNGSVILYGSLNEIRKDWEDYSVDSITTYNGGRSFVIRKIEYKIDYISRPDPNKFPPPPNQKNKKDCCMQCCSGGNQQQNRQAQENQEILKLLREIKKALGIYPFNVTLFDADDEKQGAQKKTVSVANVAQGQKLIVEREEKNAKSIGIDQFPIYVPSSVIEDETNGLLGDLGDLKNKIFKQKIESVAELLTWKIRNDNEIHGQWQEVIEIQDSDPNVKGNQPKRVVLPNMARSFKEIILLLSVLIKSQGFSMDALLKMYIDLANTKASTAVTEAIVRDIQDFLDYPTTTRSLDVPMGITIPADNDPTDDKEDIEKFLRNSKIKVSFDDWTGEGSIHDMLVVLLDAASRTIQKPHQ